MTFYSTASEVISKISKAELEEKFDIWSEGSPELKKLLNFCYQNDVVTSGCCRHSPYLSMDFEESDLGMIAKMLTGAYEATGVKIYLAKGGNPYSGPNWHKTIFDISRGSKEINESYIETLKGNSDFKRSVNIALGEVRMARALKNITNRIPIIEKLLFYITRNSIGKNFLEKFGSQKYTKWYDFVERLIKNEVFFWRMNEAVRDNNSHIIKEIYNVIKMYKTLLDKEEYRIDFHLRLQDNQAKLTFVYDEGIVGFELYDELFEKAGGKMDNDKGRHFASLSCPMNELQKIAEYLSFEFKKMEINPFELSEKATFNEKALIQQVKFGFSREGIEKMNQWINQNGWRKDKKVNY